MELHDAIKTIVDLFGKEIITEKRFLNALADYYSFRDNPAGKTVLTALVNGGYLNRFLGNPSDSELTIITSQIENEVYNNYGFRKEVIDNVIICILKGLNLSTTTAPRNEILSTFCNVTNKVHCHGTIDTRDNPTIHTQIMGNDLSYSEDYIMSLYPILFENVPYHAHMDFDVFQNKLRMESNEAFQLFRFLKGMGVYIFNVNSDDYDMTIDSEEALRKLYRDYIIQKRILNIPLSSGKSLERKYLEVIIRTLYKFKYISVEVINRELSSLKEGKELSNDIYGVLRRLNVIDDNGCCLNPYLTPEAMVNYIINKIVYP